MRRIYARVGGLMFVLKPAILYLDQKAFVIFSQVTGEPEVRGHRDGREEEAVLDIDFGSKADGLFKNLRLSAPSDLICFELLLFAVDEGCDGMI